MGANRWLLLLVALPAAVLLFTRLGSLPLIRPAEDRNAEIAREMKARGAWLIPTYDDLPYVGRPAFYFKTVVLSLGVRGDTEFAAQLLSALLDRRSHHSKTRHRRELIHQICRGRRPVA